MCYRVTRTTSAESSDAKTHPLEVASRQGSSDCSPGCTRTRKPASCEKTCSQQPRQRADPLALAGSLRIRLSQNHDGLAGHAIRAA
jgi:hypothetical protein